MALVGSSTALGNAIEAQMTAPQLAARVPDQAHHLLSSNVVIRLDAEFELSGTAGLKLAFASGYLLNGAPNGILLPTHFGHQMKVTLQRHCGNHFDEYYDNVESLLRPIYNKYKDQDVCNPPGQTNLHKAFTGAENTTRSNIESRAWWLYDWSEPLWDGDYRDEGTGNLYLNRPPDTSYKVGLQWLTDKAGDIRRRYAKQDRAGRSVNVVKKKWYDDNNYPAPSSIYS